MYTTKHFGPETSDLPAGTVRRLYTPGIDLWSDLLITLDALLTDAPDVIHLCNAGLGPWVPALRAAFPAAVTINVHGNDSAGAVGAAQRRPRRVPGRPDRRPRRGGLGAGVSSFSAGLAAAAGVDPAKVCVVENGVDCARFAPGPADAALLARLGIEPDDEVVLTVSRLVPRKGHAVGLRALAELLRRRPKALYVYTGENAQLSDELEALATKLGVRDRVRAVGFVSDRGPARALPARARVHAALRRGPEGRGGLRRGPSGGGRERLAGGGDARRRHPRGHRRRRDRDPGAAGATPTRRRTRSPACSRIPRGARDLGERGQARAVARFSHRHAGRPDRRSLGRDSCAPAPACGRSPASRRRSRARSARPASASTISHREALRVAASGVALVRLGQAEAIARRAASVQRRQSFAKIVKNGGVVRLRALEGGAALLAEALSDCAALCHLPIVEMKLRRFAEPDFQAHALPRIRGARLVQSVPIGGLGRAPRAPGRAPRRGVRQDRRPPHLPLARGPDQPVAGHPRRPRGRTRSASSSSGAASRWWPPPELSRYLDEAPVEGPADGHDRAHQHLQPGVPHLPHGQGEDRPPSRR